MSKQSTIAVAANADLYAIIQSTEQQLRGQGFDVQVTPMTQQSAMFSVSKGRDGFENIVGLGVECKVTISMMPNNIVTVNVESEWTNKIIALAVGWFLCLIPFITGIVGSVNQNSLPNKIITAVQTAVGTTGFAPNNFGGAPQYY